MKPNDSVKAFHDFAAAQGIDLNASTPREGIEAMLEFRTAVGCAVCCNDMLLYQWGSYDWGAGKYFELNITRQFIEAELEDDDAISQLSLTYKYRPSAELESLGASNCWEDGPSEFRQFILASDSFIKVADAQPDQVELIHSYV
ncbi:hypothetical protein [Duganella sp. HH105]|uniref:hypothetical protein n=1 Tax=Duganella sp. HH105 TaxID=1781067 RepID=UPI00114CF9EE|nr:hypothetical protein [Duganella sp. HH105]